MTEEKQGAAEWPRFEDGELVKIGDEVEYGGKAWEIDAICLDREEWSMALSRNLDISRMSGSYGELVKRPTPKVLGADGAPINVGDIVWTTYGERMRRKVTAVGFEGDGVHDGYLEANAAYVENDNGGWDLAKNITHKRPDSWRSWGEDLEAAAKAGEVDKAAMMRRAKALAKAGE